MPRRGVLVWSALIPMVLLAAACGGDSGGDETSAEPTTTTAAGSTTTTAEPTTTTAEEKAPTTWPEWEADAARRRAAVLKKIKDNGWGLSADGKTLTGPEGFKVDLTKCPAGWSNTEGLTDDTIKIGHTFPYSGTLADYGNIGRAMENYFNYVNDTFGGIKDSTGKTRKMVFLQKDDGYDPARTIPLVDELMDSEKVFALSTGGSPSIMRVYDKVNQRCVPQPMVHSGHPAWGDPVNHPWTAGYILAYNTEAILWGSYIEKELPKGTKVAALIMNNDFGEAYKAGMEAFIAQSDHNITFEFETIEPSAPTVTNEMTTLAAKNPDVFIAMTAGTSCTQAITEAAQNGLKDKAKQLWQPSVCKGINFLGKDKVGGDGSASDGWLIIGGGSLDFNDPAIQDNQAIQFAKAQLAKSGYDTKTSSQFGNGYIFAYPYVEYFRVAAELPGGLNRTNLMLAVRSIEVRSPFMLPGIRLTMNGNKDAYMVEGSEIARFSAAKQSWETIADVIDLSGKSPNCPWSQASAGCG